MPTPPRTFAAILAPRPAPHLQDEVDTMIRDLREQILAQINAAGRIPTDGDLTVYMGGTDPATGEITVKAEWVPERIRFYAAHEQPNYLDHGPRYADALQEAATAVQDDVERLVVAGGYRLDQGAIHVEIDPSTKMFAATWTGDSTTTPTPSTEENL